MRLLRPEDGAHLIEFFESHTPETIHNRYGYSIVRMSPERAAELVGVDQSRDAALGLFEGGAANERLVAVGRCCRLDREDTAEMAFVVHEERRRLGMAGALLRALASLMRHRGVTHLVAQVQQDNEAMLGLFHKAGAAVSAIGGTDGLKVSLSLPGTPSPPRPGRP
jgi:ribosomal protein S18 acetylase RimI-like enzyme